MGNADAAMLGNLAHSSCAISLHGFISSNCITIIIILTLVFTVILLYVLEKAHMQLRIQSDLTKKAEVEEARYRVAMEISNDILFEYDIQNDIMTNSPKFTEVYGRYFRCTNFRSLNDDMKYIHREDMSVYQNYLDDLVSGKEMIECEFRMLGASGEYIWGHVRGKTIFDDTGRPVSVIGKIVNINLQKKELEKLTYKAQMDPCTGVYNKEAFSEIVGSCLERGTRGEGKLAFAIIDVDNFKKFNDTYGHLFGDTILKEIVSILKEVFGHNNDIVGRVGGDEFAILMKVDNMEQAEARIAVFMDKVRNSRMIDDKEVAVTVSMGVAIADRKHKYNDVFKRADSVLYDVKNRGKNDYAIA